MAVLNFNTFATGDSIESGTFGGTISYSSSVTHDGEPFSFRTNPTGTGTGFQAVNGYSATTGAGANFNAADLYGVFYFLWLTKPASNEEMFYDIFSTSSNRKMEWRLNSSAQVVLYDKSLAHLATSTVVLGSNVWYRLEYHCSTGATAAYEVKIFEGDQTTPLETLSGTGDLHTGNAIVVNLGKRVNRNGQSVDFYFSDHALSDSGYFGPVRAKRLAVNGNGNYTAATIGAGSGSLYQQVDETTPDDDTTYLLTDNSIGSRYTAAFASAVSSGIPAAPLAVKGFSVVKTNGGGSSAARMTFRSNTTDVETTSSVGPGSYTHYAILRETDPATSAAWTLTGVDGLEFGVKEQHATVKSRITQIVMTVLYTPPAPPPAYAYALLVG